jgi:hypothetical protein
VNEVRSEKRALTREAVDVRCSARSRSLVVFSLIPRKHERLIVLF